MGKERNDAAQAFPESIKGIELDRLVATSSHSDAEIETTVAQFVARQ
jgi:hypothetical protein